MSKDLSDEEHAEEACRELAAMYGDKAARETRQAFREAALEWAQHYASMAESMRRSRA
jgi:hypothetical protein